MAQQPHDRLARPGRPIAGLASAIEGLKGPAILVSNEVGMGMVPDNKLGRVSRLARAGERGSRAGLRLGHPGRRRPPAPVEAGAAAQAEIKLSRDLSTKTAGDLGRWWTSIPSARPAIGPWGVAGLTSPYRSRDLAGCCVFFNARRRNSAAHFDVAHDGEVYRVALKRVAASRRFTLRVRTATRDVLLTMPSRSSLKAAREFAERHAAWIGARLARLPQPVAFEPRAVTPLRGVDHRIVHRPGERGVVWLEMSERGPLICVSGDRPHVPRRVADFLKREARKDLEAAVARHSKQLGQAAAHRVARYGQPVGFLFVDRRAQFFLAADSRSVLRARLSRRA